MLSAYTVAQLRAAERVALARFGEPTLMARASWAVAGAVLDATNGLEQTSAKDRATRAWRVATPVDEDAVTAASAWWRTALVLLQGLGIVVVAVLCAPTQRREERA